MSPEQMMGMMKQMKMMERCSNMMQGGPHGRSDAASPEKKD